MYVVSYILHVGNVDEIQRRDTACIGAEHLLVVLASST